MISYKLSVYKATLIGFPYQPVYKIRFINDGAVWETQSIDKANQRYSDFPQILNILGNSQFILKTDVIQITKNGREKIFGSANISVSHQNIIHRNPQMELVCVQSAIFSASVCEIKYSIMITSKTKSKFTSRLPSAASSYMKLRSSVKKDSDQDLEQDYYKPKQQIPTKEESEEELHNTGGSIDYNTLYKAKNRILHGQKVFNAQQVNQNKQSLEKGGLSDFKTQKLFFLPSLQKTILKPPSYKKQCRKKYLLQNISSQSRAYNQSHLQYLQKQPWNLIVHSLSIMKIKQQLNHMISQEAVQANVIIFLSYDTLKPFVKVDLKKMRWKGQHSFEVMVSSNRSICKIEAILGNGSYLIGNMCLQEGSNMKCSLSLKGNQEHEDKYQLRYQVSQYIARKHSIQSSAQQFNHQLENASNKQPKNNIQIKNYLWKNDLKIIPPFNFLNCKKNGVKKQELNLMTIMEHKKKIVGDLDRMQRSREILEVLRQQQGQEAKEKKTKEKPAKPIISISLQKDRSLRRNEQSPRINSFSIRRRERQIIRYDQQKKGEDAIEGFNDRIIRQKRGSIRSEQKLHSMQQYLAEGRRNNHNSQKFDLKIKNVTILPFQSQNLEGKIPKLKLRVYDLSDKHQIYVSEKINCQLTQTWIIPNLLVRYMKNEDNLVIQINSLKQSGEKEIGRVTISIDILGKLRNNRIYNGFFKSDRKTIGEAMISFQMNGQVSTEIKRFKTTSYDQYCLHKNGNQKH